MADDLVLHYQGTDRLLGSPAHVNVALGVAGVLLMFSSAVWLLIRGQPIADLALWPACILAPVLLLLIYARLRFANAGIYLADGRVGVIGTLGGRTGVETSQLDHFQLCTLSPQKARSYRVLLFVNRTGRAVLRLPVADLIPQDGLADFVRRSGVPLHGSWDDRLTPSEMAQRYPGSVSRTTLFGNTVAAHPTRTTLISFAVTVLAGVIFFIVVQMRS